MLLTSWLLIITNYMLVYVWVAIAKSVFLINGGGLIL